MPVEPDHTDLRAYVDLELGLARGATEPSDAFHHLERAHILSQYSTRDHVRVHMRMLQWAWSRRDLREALGQVVRIIGAATKTAFGLIPVGNTGGANVSPIKPMPVPLDLAKIIAANKR